MAQEAKITQLDVDAICARLTALGQRPTSRKILAEHGAGSISTIHRMLTVWQAGHPRIEAPPMLSEGLQKALAVQLQAEVNAARAELLAQIEVNGETILDLTREAEKLGEDNFRLRAEIDALHDSETALKGQIQQMQTDMANTHVELARERAEAEQARQARAVAELRAANAPKMEAELAELRAALAAEQTKRMQAEQACAVSEAKREGLEVRLTDEQARNTQAQVQLRAAHEQIDKMQKDATRAEVRVEAAHARLESAEARMTNAEKRADRYKDEAKEANAKASQLEGEARALQAALAEARGKG